jgi:ATP-dependent Lon protease
VPEGAIPKDGPSAGITLTTAIVSAFTKISVHKEVAMTGEVTLRGRVLEIGGLKEKVLAAHRAGVKTIIAPSDNQRDLEDTPDYVQKDLKFVFVKHMDDVLKEALIRSPQPKISKPLPLQPAFVA